MELLAVIAVVGVLASLLLGAVDKARTKARNTASRLEAASFVQLIRERLSVFYESQTDYPAWTTEELHQQGVFDDRIMKFLHSSNVTFTGFSSTDPDQKCILQVQVVGANHPFGLLKKSVTKDE